jgi:hypothetical protein
MWLTTNMSDEWFSDGHRLQIAGMAVSRFWPEVSTLDHCDEWVASVNQIVQRAFPTEVELLPMCGASVFGQRVIKELLRIGRMDMEWLIRMSGSGVLRGLAVGGGLFEKSTVMRDCFGLMPRIAQEVCDDLSPDSLYFGILDQCWQAMLEIEDDMNLGWHEFEWKRRPGVRAMIEIVNLGKGAAKNLVLEWAKKGVSEDLDSVLVLGALESISAYYEKEDLASVWDVITSKLQDTRRAVIKAVAYCIQALVRSPAFVSCLDDFDVLTSLDLVGQTLERLLNEYREDLTVVMSRSLANAMEGAMELLLEILVIFHSSRP